MKRRIEVIVFLVAAALFMGLAAYLHASQVFSGPGLFISQNQCTDISNPVAGQSWCFDATNDVIDYWNGAVSAWLQPNPITLGANGGTGGSIVLKGATSGSASIGVAAAAGTPTQLVLPTTTGTNGYVLSTNGGTPQQLSWIAGGSAFPAGTSLYFGGALFASGAQWAAGTGIGAVATMQATRALTVDKCTVWFSAFGSSGSCTQYPIIEINDLTTSTVLCTATTASNTGTTGTSVTVASASVASGDMVSVGVSQTATGTCNAAILGMSFNYH